MFIYNKLITNKLIISLRRLTLSLLIALLIIPLKVQATDNVYLNQLMTVFSGQYSIQASSEFGKGLKNLSGFSLVKHFSNFRFIELNQTNYLNSHGLTIGTNLFKEKLNLIGYEFDVSYEGSIIRESDKEVIFDSKDMLSFVNQIVINYDLSESIEFKITPKFLHQNLADTKRDPEEKGYPWDMWFLGTTINYKISDSINTSLEIFNQTSDNNISTGMKSGYDIGLRYTTNSRTYLISYSNFSKLSKNSILNNLGLYDNDQPVFRVQLAQNFTLKK
tara:strand:- start:19 stop:846 length:828 start_codon:yes stop_codon:yes gene_type:complete